LNQSCVNSTALSKMEFKEISGIKACILHKVLRKLHHADATSLRPSTRLESEQIKI
jgi:hypothetical protein